MSTPNRLNEIFKQVGKEFDISKELVEECFNDTINVVKQQFKNPENDSIEILGFGSFRVTKYTLFRTLKTIFYKLRFLRNEKIKDVRRQQFRTVWNFKQRLIHERIRKGLPSYDKKRCV